VGGTPEIENDSDVKVEWVSWEGRPSGQPLKERTPDDRQKAYETNHKPLAEKYDVPLNLVSRSNRTTDAHLATYYAREMGKLREFRDRIYQARWVEDLDLENTDVLARCGEEVGLDGKIIRQVIKEKRYLNILHSQRAQGKSLGIFGIPSFVVQGKIFWGKDVIEDVKTEVARLKQEKLKEQDKDN
jgi:predicted DsbA family dithiol-disulfide isomerase